MTNALDRTAGIRQRSIATRCNMTNMIRTVKIATIEAAHAQQLGRINPALMAEVDDQLKKHLGV